MSYYKDSEFEAWLAQNGDKQAKQSRGYIDSIVKNILCPNHIEGIIVSMDKAIKQKQNALDKLRDLCKKLRKASCLKSNNPVLSILPSVNANSLAQWCVILDKYIEFLEQTEPNSNKSVSWGAQAWNNALSDFWTSIVIAVSIDGYTALLNAPSFNGSIDAFVRLAVESSCFMSKTAVRDQQNALVSDIKSGFPVWARHSTDKKVQYQNTNGILVFDDGKGTIIPIKEDPDNNRAVRDLIEGVTGFTISAGADSFFTNFKFSHIWQNAIDPRYFTSLWNIVLVPAWANDILDKTTSNSVLSKKMLNTFKAVCEKLYGTSAYWTQLGILPQPSIATEVAHATYDLNVIRNSGSQVIGSIVKQSVTI